MVYGGWKEDTSRCGEMVCDGMPVATDQGWRLQTDARGCQVWSNPKDAFRGGTQDGATTICGGVTADAGPDGG